MTGGLDDSNRFSPKCSYEKAAAYVESTPQRRLLKTARRDDQSAIRHDDVRYHLHPRCALRPRPRRRLRRARRRARACRPRAPRPGRLRREEGCVRFQPFCCCRAPRRTRSLRAGDPTDACGVGSTVARRAFVAVSRRDPRASLATPASAPSPPSPRASTAVEFASATSFQPTSDDV